jgi:DNA-binding NarL/FixJ family response regulator
MDAVFDGRKFYSMGVVPIRILLVDDHRILRDGLRSLLRSQPDLDVIGEAQEGRTSVKLAIELCPDVVVMDISMPDLNGVEATRQIKAHCANTRVIVLSGYADKKIAVDAMNAGATGLVPKAAAFEELVLAIRTAVAGKVYLSTHLPRAIVDAITNSSSAGSEVFGLLSPRERQVLQLIAEGNSTKQIAMHLDVCVKTIETFRRQIMEKLGLDNIAGLTKYAVREGLTAP